MGGVLVGLYHKRANATKRREAALLNSSSIHE
jgi:hypothetical protein